MFRLRGRTLPIHQGDEGLLQNVFRFGVRQAKGAAIKEQLRSPGPVQGLEPCRSFALNIHKLTG
jgi:hypothetical protein